MIAFFHLLIFRMLSGWQNGLGYADKERGRLVLSIILILLALAPTIIFAKASIPVLAKIASIILAAAAAFAILGVESSFNALFTLITEDLHFWELLATGLITIAWLMGGGNLLWIFASVYPALIVHKGLINLYSGLGFWDIITDDPTGRTFSFLGGKFIRAGNAWRLLLAFFSIALATMTYLKGWTITIFPLLIDLHGTTGG